MRNFSPARWFAAALVLTAAGCSDDDPTGPSEDLSAAEATELAGIVAQLAVQQGFSAAGDGTANAPAAVPVAFENSVEFTTGCPRGGTVGVVADVSGTVDSETGALDSDLTVVQTHANCQASGGQTGAIYTLDGAPNLTIAMGVETNTQSGNFSITAAFDGAVAWSTDDRSGTCTMNLDVASSGSTLAGTGTNTVTGTICGITVSSAIGF